VLVSFDIGSHLMPKLAWIIASYLCFSNIASMMTGTYHYAQPLVEIGSGKPISQASIDPTSSRSLPPK
jgi:hypothetical protein